MYVNGGQGGAEVPDYTNSYNPLETVGSLDNQSLFDSSDDEKKEGTNSGKVKEKLVNYLWRRKRSLESSSGDGGGFGVGGGDGGGGGGGGVNVEMCRCRRQPHRHPHHHRAKQP